MSDRWFFRQRQEWIAQMVRIYGFINREHLMKKFEISMPQASTDIQYFQTNNPGIIEYSKSRKRYEGMDRLASAQDARDAYETMVTGLQQLCTDFGCLGGEHRLNWLRDRLGRLQELEALSFPSQARSTTENMGE